ncbi:MAG: hypothetical protein JNL83_14465 [Myxococcales bacterium]|nr:hypothetical protein [Myxococcales bacterium]
MNASAVAAVDLDADGLIDLAAVDPYTDSVELWLAASAGGLLAFGPRTAIAAARDPMQILVDDANGESVRDLAGLGAYVGELSI